MRTILIIEDETELVNVLKAYLERAGYDVLAAGRGDMGLDLWREHHPDMVLLDLNLPGMDGIDIIREIRQSDDTPVIMTTARVEEVDRLVGLELGADDYITKPFSPREVVARVKAVLRRVEKSIVQTLDQIEFDGLKIDINNYSILQSGNEIELTPTEFSILITLLQQSDTVNRFRVERSLRWRHERRDLRNSPPGQGHRHQPSGQPPKYQ